MNHRTRLLAWTMAVMAPLLGCSAAPGETFETDPADVRADALDEVAAEGPVGTTYAIHVGGLCSTRFVGGKGDGGLGVWPGVVSVDAIVDQRDSMATATSQLRGVLDTYCLGDDACYVLTYSNGGAVMSRVLSLYDAPWNILFVVASASNEGGSELGGTGWLGEHVGGCRLAGHVGTTDHRTGWDHDDTGGVTFYGVGGYDGWWYSSALVPKRHDGAVSFHSAGGLAWPRSTDTLCHPADEHYAFHRVAWTCDGYPLDHIAMKTKGICGLGGCEGP